MRVTDDEIDMALSAVLNYIGTGHWHSVPRLSESVAAES